MADFRSVKRTKLSHQQSQEIQTHDQTANFGEQYQSTWNLSFGMMHPNTMGNDQSYNYTQSSFNPDQALFHTSYMQADMGHSSSHLPSPNNHTNFSHLQTHDAHSLPFTSWADHLSSYNPLPVGSDSYSNSNSNVQLGSNLYLGTDYEHHLPTFNTSQTPKQQQMAVQAIEQEPSTQENGGSMRAQQHQIQKHPQALRFTGLRDAIASLPRKTWTCPSPDGTIPTTDQERQAWVLSMVNAIKNTDRICDKSTTAFRKRWGPLASPDDRPFYSAVDIEIVAWDILRLAEGLHTEGPSVLASFDARFWQTAATSRRWTFAERMNKIVALLSSSKARCDKLLQGVSLQQVVTNPEKLMKVTKQNGTQNARRQYTLVAGRKALKRKAGE